MICWWTVTPRPAGRARLIVAVPQGNKQKQGGASHPDHSRPSIAHRHPWPPLEHEINLPAPAAHIIRPHGLRSGRIAGQAADAARARRDSAPIRTCSRPGSPTGAGAITARRRRCSRRRARRRSRRSWRSARRPASPLVPQGGNTSMVGGATPDGSGDALLLSTAADEPDPQPRRRRRHRGLRGGRDPRRPARGGAGGGPPLPADPGRARARRRSAAWSRPMPAAPRCCASGRCGALVLGIEAVLPDGSLFDGLTALKKDNRGYDLRQLLIGAEGTLGIVTAASLRLVPAVGSRAVAWVGVEAARDAMALLRHLEATMGEAIESFELVPRSALDLVLAHIPGTRPPLAAPAPWNVLVEAVAPMAAPGPEPLLYEGAALGAGDGDRRRRRRSPRARRRRRPSGGCATRSRRPRSRTGRRPSTTSRSRSRRCRTS